mgnify:CR=1 FL=1
MQQLEALSVPTEMQWIIYALYKSMSKEVWSPNSLSEAILYGNLSYPYVLCSVIRQLRISSRQLEIEVCRNAQTPLEEKICQLCHQGVEFEERYLCHYIVFL